MYPIKINIFNFLVYFNFTFKFNIVIDNRKAYSNAIFLSNSVILILVLNALNLHIQFKTIITFFDNSNLYKYYTNQIENDTKNYKVRQK